MTGCKNHGRSHEAFILLIVSYRFPMKNTDFMELIVLQALVLTCATLRGLRTLCNAQMSLAHPAQQCIPPQALHNNAYAQRRPLRLSFYSKTEDVACIIACLTLPFWGYGLSFYTHFNKTVYFSLSFLGSPLSLYRFFLKFINFLMLRAYRFWVPPYRFAGYGE